MTPAEQVAYAVALSRSHGVMFCYTRAGWTISMPGDPILDVASADDDLAACGTHAAFNRHKAHGLTFAEIDEACKAGERRYQNKRNRERRAARAEVERRSEQIRLVG